MKTRTIIIGLLVTVIVSSCTVLSFYPLYTDKELVRDDRIIGEWQCFIIRTFGHYQETEQ